MGASGDDQTTHVPCPLCDVGHVHPDLAAAFARGNTMGQHIRNAIAPVLVLVVLGWVVAAAMHRGCA